MCKRHNVCAPIFIDNAEAINNILDVDSQLVRLVVSNDSELVVVNG
jgi:exonuclease SbcC